MNRNAFNENNFRMNHLPRIHLNDGNISSRVHSHFNEAIERISKTGAADIFIDKNINHKIDNKTTNKAAKIKQNETTYVYQDFSRVQPDHDDPDCSVSTSISPLMTNAGSHYIDATTPDIKIQKLPAKLDAMLSNPDISHIITWMPHGRAWKVLRPKDFVKEVAPKYFEYPNYNSFVRLVNAWGFRRITTGVDSNAYFHELFLRGMPHLHKKMRRLNKNEKKSNLDPSDEPDFYAIDKVAHLPIGNGNNALAQVSAITPNTALAPNGHQSSVADLQAALSCQNAGRSSASSSIIDVERTSRIGISQHLMEINALRNQLLCGQQQQGAIFTQNLNDSFNSSNVPVASTSAPSSTLNMATLQNPLVNQQLSILLHQQHSNRNALPINCQQEQQQNQRISDLHSQLLKAQLRQLDAVNMSLHQSQRNTNGDRSVATQSYLLRRNSGSFI